MKKVLFPALLCVVCFSLNLQAQSSNAKLLEELLDLPAPRPGTVQETETDEEKNPPEFYDIVRLNLKTGREHKINIKPSNNLFAVSFVPVQDKVLIYREGEKGDEYYLLDADTGKTELVKGEFRPLGQQTFRPLQSTGNANEFWAAIPSEDKTEIGRYNTQNFSFKSILTIPQIALDSMDIWVDEKESKLFFVYSETFRDSHLLSLPLPKE